MENGMIQAQATAARIACTRMTVPYLTELHDSVERACGMTGRSQWGRKAAAHAEIFSLLAGMVDDPLLAPLPSGGTAHVRELMLAHLCAGDGDAAAVEMERHLRSLLYMRRVALPGRLAAVSEAAI